MPKLALIATVEVAPEKRDQVQSLLSAHGARSLRDEPGTLHFEILVPREDAAKLLIYEVYQDDAAFEAHRNARSIAQFREESAGLGVKISATRCTPAA
ncbi:MULTISPECIES: putative quinol monooxygenase [Bradyrhizobium]|uniref:Antibiotic biosynthesis monooxygenase n=1 Tax=Bradyrhizobium uaiense TaxID=2594946 RepID=A0A6P1BQ39_9BRAD|nr:MULTISPECIES: antibiotic biosynthesis monooxygenase family protein [Bradyrhizobium]MCC8964730.1 antibiotic biosynthesis monooxygenase [Bradyrhizobium oropedii]NEU99780.1 antibiotic biosynthesis monooxygenase [Bradyrhizobium uaiense]